MYSMALDNSWAIMNEEEMYDVNGGGSAIDWATNIVCGLIATALWEIGKWAITSGMVKTALIASGAAANAVWAGIASAAAWIWNTPVALGILAGVVGIGVGIVIGYYGLK